MNTMSSGHRRRSTTRPSHRRGRSRRGWAALTVGAVLASAGMVVGAQSSYAADGVLSGQTPSGTAAPFGWVDTAKPLLIFDVGVRTPTIVSINAPGYNPLTIKTRGAQSVGYCIEPNNTGEAQTYQMIFPDEYIAAGTNRTYPMSPNFARNVGKITWIAQNAYPSVDAATFSNTVGTSGTQSDLYYGVQAAIWHFTSGLNLTMGSPATKATYQWLINNAKDIAPAQPQLSVTPATASKDVGGAATLVGPITVKAYHTVTSLSVAAASLPAGVTLTDAQGAALPATITNGTAVYAKVAPGTPSGSVNLTFKGQGHATVNGMIAVGTHSRGGSGKAQSQLLTGQPTTSTISTTATLSWSSSGPAPTPPPPAPQSPAPAPAPAPAPGNPTAPSIGTIATGSDGTSKSIPLGAKNTGGVVLDKVMYRGLTGGQQYTVSGVLMDKATNTSTNITSSRTFTADPSGSGAVTVPFRVPASMSGKTLVAFETVSQQINGVAKIVAEHKDINDPAQTVTVGGAIVPGPAPQNPQVNQGTGYRPTLPKTGVDDLTWRIATLGLGVLLMGGGMTLLTRRRVPTYR